jgi:hypothetical protein
MESTSYLDIISYSIGNVGGTSISGLIPGFGLNVIIEVDHEFGNILIRAGNRMPRKSEEGIAFVTVGVDENDELVYISIEPEDEDLAKFIRRIRV